MYIGSSDSSEYVQLFSLISNSLARWQISCEERERELKPERSGLRTKRARQNP